MGLEWRIFAESTKEKYEQLKNEKKIEEIKEVYILFENIKLNELKIIDDNIMEFRIRNSRDKFGYERWSNVFEEEIQFKNKELSIKKVENEIEEEIIEPNEIIQEFTLKDIQNILKLKNQNAVLDQLKEEKNFKKIEIKKLNLKNGEESILKLKNEKYFKTTLKK
eukprot:gene5833-9656_t